MTGLIEKRKYIKDTLALKEEIEGSFLVLGERLKKIRDEELYLGDYDSFPEFLFALKISEGMASKLISIFSHYVLKYDIKPEKLAPIGWTGLYQMLPLVTSKEKADELVDTAANLRRDDIKEMVREETVGKNCKHDFIKVCFRQCTKCSLREKQYED